MISKTNTKLPLVVLEGLKAHNRFYSTNDGSDPSKLANGKVVYKVLAYCDTGDEALAVIRGDGYNAMEHYLAENKEMFDKLGLDPSCLVALETVESIRHLCRTPAETIIAGAMVHKE